MKKSARMVMCCAAVAAAVNMAFGFDSPDMDWYEAKDLGLEGQIRGEEFERPYDRLPISAQGKAPEKFFQSMGRHSTGMSCRFVPYADKVVVKWTTKDVNWLDPLMTPCAMGGVDVYGWREDKGKWWFMALGKGTGKGEAREAVTHRSMEVKWTPGMPCLVNFPLRAEVKSLRIGVPKGMRIEKAAPHKTAGMPVVIYGTSLVHGCNASRPGMLFSSIASRLADVEIVNLGFSGSAKMEIGVCDVLSGIDASLYIIDPLKNMGMDLLRERFEPFLRKLKETRSDTPIIICEDAHPEIATDKSLFVREIAAKLKAEDAAKWSNLHVLAFYAMYPGDGEETVDGVHPNDWGMMHMGKAYAATILEILGEGRRSLGDPLVIRVLHASLSLAAGEGWLHRDGWRCEQVVLSLCLLPDEEGKGVCEMALTVSHRPYHKGPSGARPARSSGASLARTASTRSTSSSTRERT